MDYDLQTCYDYTDPSIKKMPNLSLTSTLAWTLTELSLVLALFYVITPHPNPPRLLVELWLIFNFNSNFKSHF